MVAVVSGRGGKGGERGVAGAPDVGADVDAVVEFPAEFVVGDVGCPAVEIPRRKADSDVAVDEAVVVDNVVASAVNLDGAEVSGRGAFEGVAANEDAADGVVEADCGGSAEVGGSGKC